MMVKIRVNGFGHTGCLVTRAALNSDKVDIVTIGDPFIDLKHMVCMFQYDSTHGKFKGTVKAETGSLSSMESPSPSSRSKSRQHQMGDAGAEYVVESTGVFTTTEKAGAHLEGGSKRVIISAPSVMPPCL
ncbi:Glyceraldehyde-3-phosphate dehydrogenase [Myotis davidii]|uniref:Glyceraldehyde-3-phosphate dehydrogenase n=1 Tax=Myotis davidii TaxID=225400 RepID=L5MCT1_MYODS|nr:Glyceraldehyde-3-phosphate dehydrogenase [Myotis davidii]